MINVVKCVSSGSNGTEWYPSTRRTHSSSPPWGHCVPGGTETSCDVSRRMAVEGLEIYDSSWFAVGFANNHHSVTPGVRCADRDFFQYPETDITIEVLFDCVLPVNGH